MIELTFEEGKFQGAERWEDITLKQFIRVCEVEIPSRLRELLIASTALNDTDPVKLKKAEEDYDKIAGQVTTRDLVQTFPKYYGELMEILTEVPREIIDRIDGTLRAEFFDRYLRYVVLSIFYTQPIKWAEDGMEPYFPEKPIDKFELDGVEYLLPKTLKLYGQDIFLHDEPVISFAEASEIEIAYRDLLEKGVDRMPMFVALYCRPEGEKYNEQKVLRREPMMKRLTMDVVWSVFFCIGRLQGRYKVSILRSTGKVMRRLQEQ